MEKEFRVSMSVDGELYRKWRMNLKINGKLPSSYSGITHWNEMLFEKAMRLVLSGDLDISQWR